MTTNTITEDRLITINYGISLEDMTEAGRYDWINPNITPKTLPIAGVAILEFETKVFHFDRHISSEGAVAAIKSARSEERRVGKEC